MTENSEELVSSNDHQTQIMIKGKRTKRQKASSPPYNSAMASSSSTIGGGKGHEYHNSSSIYSSPTTSSTDNHVYDSTEEDEDMANCLILLAQGDGARKAENDGVKVERCGGGGGSSSSRKFMETVSSSAGKVGFYVYECKTCNRTFPSFQALGGHRASHKKPKINLVEEKKDNEIVRTKDHDDFQFAGQQLEKSKSPSTTSPPSHLALQMVSKSTSVQGNNKGKTHECSICGTEFTSGQALGGHMRRHRAPPAPTGATQATVSVDPTSSSNGLPEPEPDAEQKPRNILPLDLNLPAPEDDQRDAKFQFVTTPQQSLVLSSPALVDCHY